MVDFAGWSMPVQYTSIVAEHNAARNKAALFDISHMGRFRFNGPGAVSFLDRLVTRRIADLEPGSIRYALVTNQQGGILDDVLVYRLIDSSDHPVFWMVVNASNRTKIADWIQSHRSAGDDFVFQDRTLETAMIAIQGPKALETAQSAVPDSLADLAYYTGTVTVVQRQSAIVSRTGYTGEDGCELIVPTAVAGQLWQTLMDRGRDLGVVAAGLGARDTLRLEAAMPLYGHELSEDVNPLQAGLRFAVNTRDRQFPGRDALAELRNAADQPQRVGLDVEGKRVARQHYPIVDASHQIGEITSGTFSPTLQRSIAMGYVRPEFAKIGTRVTVDIRGRPQPARITQLPFYKRS
jgi:aminomethyltransferase